MKTFNIFKNLSNIIRQRGTRGLGSISPNSSMTIHIPSSHYGLIILHGVYTSLTAIIEAYVNSNGTSYARVMAVSETAQTRDFAITTSTNTITIANNHTSGYITSVQFISNKADDISVGG